MFFDPWIGPLYGFGPLRPLAPPPPGYSGFSTRPLPRLLLVSESHHLAVDDHVRDDPVSLREITRRTVEDWRGHGPNRHLDRACSLLNGAPPNRAHNPIADLDWIAFYNFVQVPVLKGVKPTEQDLLMSAPRFPAVMRELSPTHIICASHLCWCHFPQFDRGASICANTSSLKATLGGQVVDDIGMYDLPKGSALVMKMEHLRRAPNTFQSVIKDFLLM